MGTSLQPDAGAQPNGGVQIVPNQPTMPAKSAVAIASDNARAAIAAGQTLAGAAPPAGQTPPGQQPPIPAAPVAPVVPKPAEGQPAPKPGEAAPNGVPGQQAAADETPEAKAAREAAEALVVEIPFGETDEETLVINAADPEMAANIREIVEIATSAQALHEEVESLRGTVRETEELREYADADAIGFTLDMIGTDLTKAKALTLYLLTQPSLYAAVKDDLGRLADPTQFRLLAADAREQRHQMTDQAQERIETGRVVRQNLQDVQTTVTALLPDSLTPAQREQARRDCLRDLKDYADSKDLIVLPVHQIPGLLAQRLTALGIDPDEAAARAVQAAARNGGTTSTPRFPTRTAATRTPPAPPAPTPKKDGLAFVASALKKRDAAAIPNAGAGSPTNSGGLQAPRTPDGKPMGIKDTLAWHRAQRAKGIRNW